MPTDNTDERSGSDVDDEPDAAEEHDADGDGESRLPLSRRQIIAGSAVGAVGLGVGKIALDGGRPRPDAGGDAEWYGAGDDEMSDAERARREAYLAKLKPILNLEADDDPICDPRISKDWENWKQWLDETGELPPDFENLPASATLPDPLVREENGERVRIEDVGAWEDHRELIGEQAQQIVYGSMPPAPDSVSGTETMSGPLLEHEGTQRSVRIEFGSDDAATMRADLLVPEGEGPFPVFMTQWNHREWALRAMEQGYMGVVYAGSDRADDTVDYQDIYPDYEFQVLARRAWGASRVVDYLETLDEVDGDRIGITGFSRNGKQALVAGAFDERFGAVVPAGAGTGGTAPARFDRDNFYGGHMAHHTRVRRSWFHPRWRFFVGRENRLPVDANSLVAMVAPRGCMIDAAEDDLNSNAWACRRVYESALPVYDLYDAADSLAVRYRRTVHDMPIEDVDGIIDFFDHALDREGTDPKVGNYVNPSRFDYDFSFEEWAETAAADVDVESFPKKGLDDLLTTENGKTISSVEGWEAKEPVIREALRWSFGERPATNAANLPKSGSTDTAEKVQWEASTGDDLPFQIDLFRPTGTDGAGSTPEKRPAIIWLHPYSYIGGYGTGSGFRAPLSFAIDRDFAFCSFDHIGCGARKTDAEGFYERYPDWSLMGKMVADTRTAVGQLSGRDDIDSENIYLVGYSLGATVGLYAAALDGRVSGVASVSGFSPFRLSDAEKERANAVIGRHSHVHAHHPRIGLFRDQPSRMPFDFDEVLGLVAPRPVLARAPKLDWDNPQADVVECVEAARKVYDLYDAGDRLELRTPYDINSFDYEEARLVAAGHSDPPARARREAVFDWVADQL